MRCIYLVHAALASPHKRQKKYFYRKSKNFESITLLPIIYKSVTKNPKTLVNPKKSERRKKAIPIRLQKVRRI